MFIWIGYIFGIARKVIQINSGEDFGWLFYMAFVFYILNISEVTIDMMLYMRNKKLDALAEKQA